MSPRIWNLVAASALLLLLAVYLSMPWLGAHTWVIQPGQSYCTFRVKHASGSWFDGRCEGMSGYVRLDREHPERGQFDLVFPVSGFVHSDKSYGEMSQWGVFDGRRYPEVTFVSKQIEPQGDDLVVSGELIIGGRSQDITIVMGQTWYGDENSSLRGYIASFTVKRSELGSGFAMGQGFFDDEVELEASLELAKP